FNFLLKLSTGQGDHFRNYPVFLEVRPTTLSKDFQPVAPALTPATVAIANLGEQRPEEYGPVRPGETLFGIVDRFVTPPFTRHQVLAAFHELNKTVFVNGNMNGLPVGVVLKVPSMERIKTLSSEDAKALEVAQRQDWINRGGGKGGRLGAVTKTSTDPDPSRKPAADKPGKAQTKPQEEPRDVVDMRLTVSPSEKDDNLAMAPHVGKLEEPDTKPKTDEKINKEKVVLPDGKEDAAKPHDETRKDSEPALELKASGWNTGMADVENLKKEMADLTDQIGQGEAARSKLQSQLSALEMRLKKMEQEQKKQIPNIESGPPWDLVATGVGVVALVIGLLAWMSRRGRRKAWSQHPSLSSEPVLPMTPVPGTSNAPGIISGSPPAEKVATAAPARSENDRMNVFKTEALATTAASLTDDASGSGILDLGGSEEDTNTIFNLGGGKNTPPETAPWGGEKDGPSHNFNMGDERRSSGILDLGLEEEEASGPLNFDVQGRETSSQLDGTNLDKPRLGRLDSAIDDQGPIDSGLDVVAQPIPEKTETKTLTKESSSLGLETVTFEPLSIAKVTSRPPAPVESKADLETITFDLEETPAKMPKRSAERVTPGQNKASDSPKKRVVEDSDEIPELELITEEES
ncbi:MAG TPA: hypothetical protein HPQ00_07785, partial [Magnetococcales bacterium]|nr:hypothetical protein [Magnetococcales bacterium]